MDPDDDLQFGISQAYEYLPQMVEEKRQLAWRDSVKPVLCALTHQRIHRGGDMALVLVVYPDGSSHWFPLHVTTLPHPLADVDDSQRTTQICLGQSRAIWRRR